jgi:hypothetical protein
VNANCRINGGILFRESDHAPAALDRSANGDNARYPRIRRATKHVIQIVREIGIIKVGVSVYKHCGL